MSSSAVSKALQQLHAAGMLAMRLAMPASHLVGRVQVFYASHLKTAKGMPTAAKAFTMDLTLCVGCCVSVSSAVTPPGFFTNATGTYQCANGTYRPDWLPYGQATSCFSCGELLEWLQRVVAGAGLPASRRDSLGCLVIETARASASRDCRVTCVQ